MRSDLLFMDYIVCHFLLGWACDRCERSGQTLQVSYPEVHRHGSVVEVLYRVRCPCGARGSIPVRLPILAFAYVVGRLELLYAFSRGRHRKSEMSVKPEKSDLLSGYLRDFEREIAGFAARMAPAASGSANANRAATRPGQPADRERFGFNLSEDEWVDFLRRLGSRIIRSQMVQGRKEIRVDSVRVDDRRAVSTVQVRAVGLASRSR